MWRRGRRTRPLPRNMWQPSAAPPQGSRGRFSVHRETLFLYSSLARCSVYVVMFRVATRTKTPLQFDSTAAPSSPPCCDRGRRGCHGTRGVICAETMSVKSRPGLGLQRHRGLFPLEKRPERQSRLLMLGSINSDPLSEPLQQDKWTPWRRRRSFDCDPLLLWGDV